MPKTFGNPAGCNKCKSVGFKTNFYVLVATNDHSEYDCFACAILTHGDENDVLYAHDGQLHLKDFTAPFESQNCPSLAEKPKLFFIQVSDILYSF